MNRYAHPPLLIPDQAIDQFDKFTGEPGQMIEYMPHRGDPHFMEVPTPPPHLFRMREDFLDEMQAVSLTPDTLAGSVPGAKDISGRALAIVTAASGRA